MYINTFKLFCIHSELLHVSASHVAMFRDYIRDYVHMVFPKEKELILYTHE